LLEGGGAFHIIPGDAVNMSELKNFRWWLNQGMILTNDLVVFD